ncbi:hypothetical protein [Neobacillus terrae]|uniref:hypothetical protein n=1 Tax=Neobacillus terrae TaxID=3034837 RepID=UPI00140BB08F|nr:hypothetical protein [Neobacillus terrae]NHM33042.1 hypothetical protein [Neobacillus terrae]
MAEVRNDLQSEDRNNKGMDGGPNGGQLNSDNSFSDTGLENARKLEEAANTENK